MILIVVVSGLATAFFLAAGVLPWLRRRLRNPYTMPDGPDAFGGNTAWIAIQTVDADHVIRALNLTNVQMVNWRTGLATTEDELLGAKFVFVTPPVNGWTFVVGQALPYPVGARFADRCLPLLISLGKSFREVQYFFNDTSIDFFAWARFGDEKLRRAFAWGDEGVIWNKGPITAHERVMNLRAFEPARPPTADGTSHGAPGDGMPRIEDDEGRYPEFRHVLAIAAAWSLSPEVLSRLPSDPALGYVGEVPQSWKTCRRVVGGPNVGSVVPGG